MKIFGGNDYYDLLSGADDGLVLRRRDDWFLSPRETKAVGLPTFRDCALTLRGKPTLIRTDHPFVVRHVLYHVYPVVVGFCGRLHHGYATRVGEDTPVVHWEEAGFLDWMRQHDLEPVAGRWIDTHAAKDMFQRKLTPTIYNWLVAERITVLSYIGTHPETFWRVDAPTLREAQFYKVPDPYAAFQEIAMWIGGVLSETEKPAPQINSDQIKLHKHGFDQHSFRKTKAK